MPQDRYANAQQLQLNPHGHGPFCRFELPRLPASAGVYAISVGPEVVYVGECQNFAERFGPRGYGVIHPRNCFQRGQPTNCKINSRVLESHRAGSPPELWFVEERSVSRKQLEAELIRTLAPQWNGRR